MKTLTVITTTYNRAYCLPQVYNSLIAQDCKDFIWLVIDDGSNDGTDALVQQWIADNQIEIEYHYKENGGMHTARNLAYSLVKTELNTIIDSDDWMAEGAVGDIICFWNENKRDDLAGIIALNSDPDGKTIGTDFPKDVRICSYRDFFKKHKMRGDKKLIYRSELTKEFPYPEFPGEIFYPASYKFYLIDQTYDMLLYDRVVCIVDYTDNSMTRDKYAQYRSCPYGFMHYRRAMLTHKLGLKENVKQMMHYIMENSIAKAPVDRDILKRPLFYLCLIPGKLFYLHISRTKKKY